MRRRRSASALAAAGTTALLYAPFVLAAPGDFADDVIGFGGIQGLQRLPFPPDPPGDPTRRSRWLFPASCWPPRPLGAARAAPGRSRSPRCPAGLAYLLARTDEFHLVPLAAVLAPALAVAAAGARRGTPGAGGARPGSSVLGIALALIALHGLERQAGRVLHPPALAAVPGASGTG